MRDSPCKLDPEGIRRNINAGSFGRGLDYFHRRRVQWLERRDHSDRVLILYATVLGSGRKVYCQQVHIECFDDGHIDIEGDCSCPVGSNCSRRHRPLRITAERQQRHGFR